ncbi:MAG: DNA-binding protein [Pseudomonadota bacterium]
MTEKIMLSEKEVARRYPYSVHWFRRARWIGNGPSFIKVGHRVMYPLVELDKWFNQFKPCKSTSEYQNQ